MSKRIQHIKHHYRFLIPLVGLLLFVPSVTYTQIPTEGLVAYYPFNGNANDESNNGNDGTVCGATLTTDRFGDANSAYRFDGSSSYIETADIDLLDSFSLAAWAFYDDVSNGHAVVSKLRKEATSTYEMVLIPPGYFRLHTQNNSEEAVTDDQLLVASQWVFFTTVFHTNGDAELYINSRLVESKSGLPNASDIPTLTWIGRSAWGSNYFNGALDDIRIYNRALSADEIETLYHEDGWPTHAGFTAILTGPVVSDGGNSYTASWGDYDNDGDLDLFVANDDGQNNFLYTNNGDGSFTKVTTGPLVSDGGKSYGATWGDYDNDGDLDLFVTNAVGENNFLYTNNWNGSFTKVTTGPLVSDGEHSYGTAWGDCNKDGDLDLFVANYNAHNLLYTNDGDGSFTEVTTGPLVSEWGSSLGAAWGDYDNDGDLDLFVANDDGQNNFLYANNGNGSFTKVTTGPLVSDGGSSLGASWGDYDNDGDLDLFVTNYDVHNFLYANNGDGSFVKVTTGQLVSDGAYSAGTAWGDYDNDGDLDLFVANYDGNNFLYANNGNGSFTKVTTGPPVSDGGKSYGAAWGDYDNDGDLDLFVANYDGNNFLYANNGNANHWINLQLVGIQSNVSAIGAKVRLKATISGATVWQLNEISGQTGYGGYNSLNAEFGLGDAVNIDSIHIEWPSRVVWDTTNVAVDQLLTIYEKADTYGPEISNISTSTSSPQVGDNITITANVSDPQGLAAVDLHYARGGAAGFTTIPMTYEGNNTEIGTIPGSDVTFAGVVYFISAEDNLGNRDSSPIASIQVRYPPSTIHSNVPVSAFPSGFPFNRWRLVSHPSDVDDKSVNATIGEALETSPSDETWKLFRYVGPGPDDYVEADTLSPGESYFLKQIVFEKPFPLYLGSGQSVDMIGYTWTLEPRQWSFIAAPYPFQITVTADQGTYKGPFTYGAFGSHRQEGWSMAQVQRTFEPWGGYIIYNNTDQIQILEPTPPSLAKAPMVKQADEQIDGWLLRFTAESKRYFDAGNVIGRITGASEGLDDYDSPEPPYLEGYISLTMENSDWLPTVRMSKFTSDIRSLDEPNGVWDINVHTKSETGPITIVPDFEGKAPVDFRIVLLDVATRQVHDLLEDNSPVIISDYNEDFPYHLKAVAGSRAWVDAKVHEILTQLPTEFALNQNYPNPFNPMTRIQFTLPQPDKISLKVYNLLGQKVATLAEGWMELGEHEIAWSGRDNSGRPLPSGIYFAKLAGLNDSHTIKMVLMK